MPFLDGFLDNYAAPLVPVFEKKVLIYGAGNTGKDIFEYLSSKSIEVLAFIDQHASTKSEYLKKPIVTLKCAQENFGSNITVVVGVHNRNANMVDILSQLKSAGLNNVLTLFDLIDELQNDSKFRYFMTNPLNILDEMPSANVFFNLLGDSESKKIYSDIVKFRLTGNYQFCPLPDFERQYSPIDIPPWNSNLRLIDCGAYNGDSIKLFKDFGYEIGSLIAFEPDPINYQKLINNYFSKEFSQDYIFLPCGVAERAQRQLFLTGSGEGSRISEEGDALVQMISIDEAFPNWAPNLIKMDIEGGEFEALLGAKRTITRFRPGLAISAYHTPKDLWRLGLLLNSFNLDYQFFIRSHAYSSFDTVLYAVPR